MEGGITNMKQYDYFYNVEKNAVFTEKKCQFCGRNQNCLEGIYFDQPNLKSICLSCFDKRLVGVDIPDYIKKQVNKDSETKIDKLTYTPPVPWVQYNDWQVCCDDYMQYIGEWKQEDFIRESSDGNGVEYFRSLISKDLKNKVDDINVLWDDLGYDTVAFVFRCQKCNRKIVVCQSY
ncbi:CbrC family protein [uncultured Bacteroides sp.]|uniref:CbrC family protein n=1 Tax=uncultured Bacteroides sp. TaxID=162156 RepID=UPI0025972137|nr:CbrC family protein [uncultured Bacteroides sp.]